MKQLAFLLSICFSLSLQAQTLQYSPNRKLEKTVAATYYNTEFVYITNISSQTINLEYELIDNTLNLDWSATVCTNTACYGVIPKFGSLGGIQPDGEAYFSFNFAANETLGNGRLRYLITSPEVPTLADTVTFDYTVTEDGSVTAGPWARVNFTNQILTVLLSNPNLDAGVEVYNSSGNLIWETPLDAITSYPFRSLANGVYFVIIRDENDRLIRTRIAHY